MVSRSRAFLRFVGSLRVTVVLLIFSMMLVFLATMAQTRLGIWEVMSRYIRTFFVWHEIPSFGSIPVFPGGWILGGLLLLNLTAAFIIRFRRSWRMVPLLMVHGGIALLLVSEWITGMFAREMNLMFDEGEAKSYLEHPRETEFVLIETTDSSVDTVYAAHESYLADGKAFVHESLPIRAEVRLFYQNSRVFMLPPESVDGPHQEGVLAERGLGPNLRFTEESPVVSTDGRNVVSTVLEFFDTDTGTSLGTWALSSVLTETQSFTHEGRSFTLMLRPQREYLDYSLELLEFTHLRHPGTEIPSHFASRVRLRNPGNKEDREVRISMNEPLRYQGRTFYQASFANNDQTSILQVVRNPGWTLPYVACLLVTTGLVWLMVLGIGKRRKQQGREQPAESAIPGPFATPGLLGRGILLLAAIWVTWGLWPSRPGPDRPDLDAFGSLPVLADGRLKAMDSMAQGYLRALSGKTRVTLPDGRRVDAVEWLLITLARPDEADHIPVFTLFHPELIAQLNQEESSRVTLTFEELRPYGAEIQHQAEQIREKDRAERSTYESAVLHLDYLLTLYWRVRHSLHLDDPRDLALMVDQYELEVHPGFVELRGMSNQDVPEPLMSGLHNSLLRYGVLDDFAQFAPLPYRANEVHPRGEWVTMGEAFQRGLRAEALHPAIKGYRDLLVAWADGRTEAFNRAVDSLETWMHNYFPVAAERAVFEATFNRLALFWKGAALYVLIFLLTAVSWLTGPRPRRIAWGLAWLTWIAHTIGILMRMYIQERPPVTSLYASAIFVGWAGVLLGLLWECRLRNGFGLAGAAALGFLTLVVAHNLGSDGDTIEVMRAVLDSNFWLATHVVVITIGYAAVYLAGVLAIAYLVARLVPSAWSPDLARSLSGSVIGVVAFALLFSFAGTVLGGIWADQSWGRFWVWDPKENGALLIVLWMAIILHLRVGNLVSEKGLMVCAVFGNVIVAFSWFGVNMLGVGLHSYGFMEGAFFWLGLFMVSQLLLMGLALFREGA